MALPKKKKPRSLVLAGNGINCELETAFANRLVGFTADIVHINSLMEGSKNIHNYDFLNFPGGFLDGDDLGAGKAQAVKWRYQRIKDSERRFIDELLKFVSDGKLIIGICNGFQLLAKTGLLPALKGDYGQQSVSLAFNDSGRFEDRWVTLRVNRFSSCIFTRDIDRIYLPVRHGEGKLVIEDKNGGNAADLEKDGHIVMQYCKEDGGITNEFPYNPNGSSLSIGGLCDPSGRILGLMPHPEAFVHFTQHPRWTREKLPVEGDGLKIFKNAYDYIADN
ncbi:MAG: phosphoribosylformylglycinamidine synthase subunit PurQ [Syntrophorhabdales bacterium]|jgi:phosphoribosylformylglycinamidine synthase